MKRLLASIGLFAGCAPAVANPGTEPVYEAPEHASPTPSSTAATHSAQTVEVVAFGPDLYRIADGSTVDAASLNASLKGDEVLVVLLPPDVDELAVGGAVCRSACLMPHQRFIVEGVPSKASPAPSDVPARAYDGEPVVFVTFSPSRRRLVGNALRSGSEGKPGAHESRSGHGERGGAPAEAAEQWGRCLARVGDAE